MKTTLLLITLLTVSVLNAQTQLLSSIDEYDSSGNGSSWENSQGYNYEYDTNDNLISTTSYYWNVGVWIESYKEIYTYNSNNKVLTSTYQFHDSNMFVNSFRTTYTYDGNNNVIVLLDETWIGSQWENDFILDLNYVGGNIDNGIGQTWNGSAWVNEDLTTLTYSNNRLEQLNYDEWVNGSWVNSDREILSYNTNNYIISNVIEVWNGSVYVEEESTNYTIDSNGNRLSETEIYNSQSYSTNYTYDNTQLMSAFAHPFADKSGLDYIIEDFPYYNKILSQEEDGNTSRTIHNYDSALVLSVDSVEDVKEFSIYPNPVKNVLEIQTLSTIDVVEVYNMLGKRVMTTKSTKINVEHLSDGIYTVKVIDNLGNKSIKKIIKQ